MPNLRTVTALVGAAALCACTTEAPSTGVGFGSPGGHSAATATSSTAPSSPVEYDDGFMYGRLTRSLQGGTAIATLDRIRYHNIFALRSEQDSVAAFRQEVTSITGCSVSHVSRRTSNFDLTSVTAILDCG